MRRTAGIYADPPVELSGGQLRTARAAARRAARESRGSFRTARGQYRRYRRTVGEAYLDWSRWHEEYLREYAGRRRGGRGDGRGGSDSQWFGMPSGGDYTIGMP
ncbi:hypothetical protein [Nocardia sp. NBC_01327]|uniref:hypothetical protein n=1 Tax=Nocardia sp. NBC_01327 TaxID=2903593 RepID=UPI002E104BA4|nr:hypothetical protein OG326_22020 [Nocardia sp. NBC_01327]